MSMVKPVSWNVGMYTVHCDRLVRLQFEDCNKKSLFEKEKEKKKAAFMNDGIIYMSLTVDWASCICCDHTVG